MSPELNIIYYFLELRAEVPGTLFALKQGVPGRVSGTFSTRNHFPEIPGSENSRPETTRIHVIRRVRSRPVTKVEN